MHVLKLRALIRPNIGFFKELRRVEKEEFGMNSMSLAEWEQLEEGQIKIASFAQTVNILKSRIYPTKI